MYIGALIQFPDGARKIVESISEHDSIAIAKFMGKIAKYAKKENKLVKVCADDVKALKALSKALGGVTVEWGVIEREYPCE
ncbi:MAG: hypothetical protein NWE94_01865 [Candidatus Bathyarchaeota archaeon]|nr:hypothetical protein [Candidatus Bathyarchaeota archaeon]